MDEYEKPNLGEHSHMFLLDADGGVWVTGTGSFTIPFRSRPRHAKAWFNDPPSCGPPPSSCDEVEAEAVNMGHKFRPRWFLKISWKVEHGIRLIEWSVDC